MTPRLLLAATLLLAVGCSTARAAWHMPPAATRPAPPEGIEGTALAVGARAPELALPASDGRLLPLASPEGPTLIVFYRGFW